MISESWLPMDSDTSKESNCNARPPLRADGHLAINGHATNDTTLVAIIPGRKMHRRTTAIFFCLAGTLDDRFHETCDHGAVERTGCLGQLYMTWDIVDWRTYGGPAEVINCE